MISLILRIVNQKPANMQDNVSHILLAFQFALLMSDENKYVDAHFCVFSLMLIFFNLGPPLSVFLSVFCLTSSFLTRLEASTLTDVTLGFRPPPWRGRPFWQDVTSATRHSRTIVT